MKIFGGRIPHRGMVATLALLGAIVLTPAARAQEATPPGCVGPAGSNWITIQVEQLRSGKGLIAFTVYADDRSRFLVKHGSLFVARVPASDGTTRACVMLPGPGTYAIAVYHDENANQAFDRSGLGLPKEGYGFSNNPGTLLGLPSFRSVRLSVPRPGLLTRIQMKYP